MPIQQLSDILLTLLTNGFDIAKVDRLPHENNIVHTYKYDKLGAKINYSLLFTDDNNENSVVDTLLAEAENYGSTPVIISDNFKITQCRSYSKKDFFNFFGGIINTGLVLLPKLPDVLNKLGHNKLPIGLTGEPQNLHEKYVKECLQFIMESPTRRYGIERAFEKLPDIVVLSKQGFILLIDSKSYSGGFKIKADDMLRFKGYIEDFRFRYSNYFGNVFSFVIVSGSIKDSKISLNRRSNELYKTANCKLSFISSKELGVVTQFLKDNPRFRNSINWKNIFSEDVIINMRTIQKEILRLKKDNLI